MGATARDSLILELEDAILRGSSHRRVETLRRITDLFLSGSDGFDDAQVELFDDVIGRLSNAIETAARAELAERLAPVDRAPPDVIRKLAADDAIAVAKPVLTHSNRLSDEDLVDIARTKGQGHLLAISERVTVSPAVTDVLVARGDREVVNSVAANEGARFSPTGLSNLVDKAKDDEQLQLNLGQRRDLPPQVFRAVIARATESVQKRLLAAANPMDAREIQRVLASVADRIGQAVQPRQRDYTLAKRTVQALREKNQLNERALEGYARVGKFEEMLVALATLTGVPLDVTERLILGSRPDPVLILGKAAGFGWPTVRSIIMSRPNAAGTSSNAMEKALAHFECLSPQTAQRVVRFWQVRQTAAMPGGMMPPEATLAS